MALSNGKKPLLALQPMLDALCIEQAVTLDQCAEMMQEFHRATGTTVPPFELSGNQWTALINLAIARHCASETEARKQDEALIRQLLDALERLTQAGDRATCGGALSSARTTITAARLRLEAMP